MESAVFDWVITAILALALLSLAWIDIRTFRLPDLVTLPLVLAGLAVSAARVQGWPLEAGLGALLGFGVFYILGEVYFQRHGVDGLGLGDAKLLAAAGAWLGWAALPWVVLLAALPAIGVASIRRVRKLAFGPYLCASFFACWVWMLFGPT
jgi:leader peptidase (prepilin peptidase)/N-methyltransferase